METCWADSARAGVNMQATFLGGGGGGRAGGRAVELREYGVRSFEGSGALTSIRNTETEGRWSESTGRWHCFQTRDTGEHAPSDKFVKTA